VPDRDPADRVILLPIRGQAGAVHDLAGNLRPLVIRQDPIPGAARTAQCHTGRSKP